MRPIHLKPVSVSWCSRPYAAAIFDSSDDDTIELAYGAAGAALVQPPAEQPAHLVAAQHAVRRAAAGAAVAGWARPPRSGRRPGRSR